MFKELSRFEAVSKTGHHYTVVESGRIVTSAPLSGSRRELIGARDYRLDDGRDLSATSDPDEFIIVETDELIRRLR